MILWFTTKRLLPLLLFVLFAADVLAQAEVINAAGVYWRLRGNSSTDTATNFLGTLDKAYMTIRTNNVRRMTFDTSGRVGIGTTTPRGSLEVVGVADTNLVVTITNYGRPNELWFKRAQGSIGAPTILGTSGSIGRIDARGYDGSAYHNATRIEFLVDSTSGSGNMPGRIAFLTNPTFSTGAPTERMRINRNGLVGINTTTPAARLDINGDLAIRQTALTLVNGSNDNVAISPFPAANSYYRITGPSAAFSITGLSAGADGRIVILQNATTQTLTVKDQTVSSVSNRIMTGGGDLLVGDSGTVTLIYSTTDNRWQVQSFTNGTLANNAGNNSWLILGNSGTTAGTNFVGTTDAQDLVLKRFNVEGLRMTTGGALWATGNTGTGITPASGASTRMMWIPAKAAFRAGVVTGTQWDDASIGTNSSAFGQNNTASGAQSAAFGNNNTVSGQNSLVIGNGNTVAATHALVSGNGNNAAGNYSVVFNNTASSTAAATTSMAGGFQSQTQANLSIAVGYADTASAQAAVALGGFSNLASGQNSFATGNDNNATAAQAAVFGSGNTVSGSNSFGDGNNITVSGNNSAGFGFNQTVSGSQAFVANGGNSAAGNYSSVFGNTNSSTAAATTSVTGGFQSQTQANLGMAIGWADTTSGVAAVTLGGFSNLASAANAFATGNNNNATAAQAAAFGSNNTASGSNSFATGNNNNVSGQNSFVTGNANTVTATHALVSGNDNNAGGNYSVVLNNTNSTTAAATTSLAGGFQSQVQSNLGLAIGWGDTTSGITAQAFGRGNYARSFAEFVVGSFNTDYVPANAGAFNAADRAFTVGIGTGAGTRANAFTVLKGGNVRVAGLATGGAFITAPSATTDKIMFADANGDLRAFANGSSGQTLTINGSGVPVWSTASSNDWTIVGNSGTIDGTNFIGTTDNVPVNFRVNNTNAGRIDSANFNSFYGFRAGNSASTGLRNSAFGYRALFTNSTGSNNVAIGVEALQNNTANSNTAVGYRALRNSTTPENNTAIGKDAMLANANGTDNVAVGQRNMVANTGGDYNASVGSEAMFTNASGGWNSVLGFQALYTNNNGGHNTAIGNKALYSNNNGDGNTAVGSLALFKSSTINNTALGDSAAYNTIGGNSNVALGNSSMLTNVSGSRNTTIGHYADVNTSALTNATAIGALARVDASNSIVMGSVNGVNGATSNTNVGLGVNSPLQRLHVGDNTAGIRYEGVSTGGSFITAPAATTDKIMFADANGDLRAMTAGTTGNVLTYTAAGPAWATASSSAWNLTGNSGTNSGTNFIGTTDNVSWRVRTNSIERMVVDSLGYVGIGDVTPSNKLDVYYSGTNSRTVSIAMNATGSSPATVLDVSESLSPTSGFLKGVNVTLNNGSGGSTAVDGYASTGSNNPAIIMTGVKGTAVAFNSGTSYGGNFAASGAITNYGVNANVSGGTGAGTNYGGNFYAEDGSFNYGIRAYTGFNSSITYSTPFSYAGYFGGPQPGDGNVYIDDSLAIGISSPARRLHIAGLTHTARIGGLGTGGSFITTPSAVTDKIMFADANGDLRAMTAGSTGNVLTYTATGPAWGTASTDTTGNWRLTGNAGTVDGTNFIGTTDNVPFNIRVNNQEAGRISKAERNVFLGTEAAANNTTGINSVVIGDSALWVNTTGRSNVAIGVAALRNSQGKSNLVAIGDSALYNNSIGATSGEAFGLVAVGSKALFANTTGANSVAVGSGALSLNTTGSNNVAVGRATLSEVTTGFNNTAVGNFAMQHTTASRNTALGSSALRDNTTGASNTAIGEDALFVNNTGFNVAIGAGALQSAFGHSNTAVGFDAGFLNGGGTRNTFLGDSSRVGVTNLTNATAIGWNSMVNASNSMVLGSVAGVNGATSDVKVAIGTNIPNAYLDVDGDLALRPVDISLVAGANYIGLTSGGAYSFFRLRPQGPGTTISGIIDTANGKILTLLNLSQYDLTIQNDGAGVVVPARKIITSNGNITVKDSGTVMLQYNGFEQRWFVIGMSNAYYAVANDWTTLGNSGTVDGTNFIGTTDNIPFTIRTNNQQSGRVDPLQSNAFWGYWAGRDNSTGTQNVAVGTNALLLNTTTNGSTAVGNSALENNTVANNTAVGYSALQANTSGTQNTALGYRAGSSNVAGGSGTFIGYNAGPVSTGSNNTLIGRDAGLINTTGELNVFVGSAAGAANIIGQQNTFVGTAAGFTNNASFNTFIGRSAGRLNTSGSYNTFTGWTSGISNTSGIFNTFYGALSGELNTTGGQNTYIGVSAGRTGTTASFNVAVGTNAGYYDSIGNYNVYVGKDAGFYNGTGERNVFIGYLAGDQSDTSSNGVFVGNHAGRANKADENTFVGYESGEINTSGIYNTFVGSVSGNDNVTGSENTFLGAWAGYNNDNGNRNIFVGRNAGRNNFSGGSNSVVGADAGYNMVSASYNVLIGDSAGYRLNGGLSNVAIGRAAMASNIARNGFVAIGDSALANSVPSNTVPNTAVGNKSFAYATTPSQNTGLGAFSGYRNTTGARNTFAGYSAGLNTTSSNDNTFFGNQTGQNNTTGYSNTAIGSLAGSANTIGNRNTLLGDSANVVTSALTNASAVGWNAQVNANNSMVLGSVNGVNGATSSVNVGMGLTIPGTRLEVNGGLTVSDTTYTVTAAFTLTVGNRSYFRIASTVVPGTAIATLTAGLAVGQILIIECTSAAPNGIRIADNAFTNNTNMGANRDLLQNDNVSLIWNGNDWIETGYSDN